MAKLVSVFYKPFLETNDLNDRAKAYAASKGIDYEWVKIPENEFTPQRAIDALKEADAGIIDVQRYDKEIFSGINEKCKLVVRYGVGFDAVNLEDAKECGVHVARTVAANAVAVAEIAITMMLTLGRRIIPAHLDKNLEWKNMIGEDLTGKTVGIMGFGAVGKNLAKRLKGFDCRIIAFDNYHDEKAAAELGVEFVELDTLLKESDIISLHLSLNPETQNIICKETIGKMKSSAMIINTARGGLVNDEDLIDALKSGRIAGAGLDVFNVEPLPMDSPYRDLDNVVLTSHMASASMGAYWNIYKIAIDIAAEYFSGKEDFFGKLV